MLYYTSCKRNWGPRLPAESPVMVLLISYVLSRPLALCDCTIKTATMMTLLCAHCSDSY